MNAIRQSADRYYSPDDSMGYGIPDFDKAFSILNNTKYTIDKPSDVTISPNPFRQLLRIDFRSMIEKPFIFELYDQSGKLIYAENIEAIYSSSYHVNVPPAIQRGLYVCKIIMENRTYTFKVIKE